ncbi:MAG: transketolase [Proteobacteria bacterium]|nr:transketolase [Pseudomonadota bacterium]
MIPDIQARANGIRRRVLRHILDNGGGYMSQACSSAEVLSALYGAVLKIGTSVGQAVPLPFEGVPGPERPAQTGAGYNGPRAAHFDRFVFSPVHYALVLYAALIEHGRMAEDSLAQFNVDGSRLEMIGAEHSPGHEYTAGSLAQAISQAMGLALARRLRGDTGRVVVFMSDGEFEEGQTYEALAAAAFYRLDNLLVFVDANGFQCDGPIRDVGLIEPFGARIEAFGCACSEIDGHDISAILCAAGRPTHNKPHVVLCRTNPTQGLPLLQTRHPKLHYLRFTSDQERAAYERQCQAWEKEA